MMMLDCLDTYVSRSPRRRATLRAAVAIAEWSRLVGSVVTTSYDVTKDSLPVLSWTIWHPSFDRIAGALTISGADVPRADHGRITDILRSAVKP